MSEQHTTESRGLSASSALLCALVVVLGAALWNRAPLGASSAVADMAIDKNGYTMITTSGGNDEILVVVDSRSEFVMVYRVNPTGGLNLIEREALPALFTRARAQARGRP